MNIEYEKTVGQNIRKYRTEQKLTQEQLSAKLQVLGCDITRSALAKIEAGQRHIYIDELKNLVNILNVSYTDLLN
ncbi:MAG: helix-turn-helix transcriptional regulator [Clostridia bacterium]